MMQNKRTQQPTVADVARLAGVSISTVSRVVNDSAVVQPETAQRVREAIEQLRYSPHPAARTLASRRTQTIGLWLPEISGAFFTSMLRGIEAGVREANYSLLIYASQDLEDHPPVPPLGEHNTDGVIAFTESLSNAEIVRFAERGFPLVLLHQTPPPGCPVPVVTVENKDGAFKIVDHLVSVHHKRRIGFLRGQANHEDSVWRERGYREALAAHGIPFDPELVAEGGFMVPVARETVAAWLRAGLDFDAIFAGDDESAMGAIAALRQAGLRIPEDVAVVGFDDVPFAEYTTPALTTVHAPTDQVGREAVGQLVRLIQGETVEPLILLPTELVVRNSCGCE